MENFSACKRNAVIEKLGQENFDILIFGGGITGAGIALDAVTRGLSVALIEKEDFASGTSSRSTKLIHGGFRYLKQLQFRFVSQLGNERRLLHSLAQNNVIPTAVILPIYKKGLLKKCATGVGLFLYSRIAKVRREYKWRWIKRNELIERYNFLDSKQLRGGYLYYEFKTNDGRLVIENLKKSAEHGAVCLNYTEPTELIQDEEQISGAWVVDRKTGEKFTINAKMIINATGAWCQDFMKKFNLELPKKLYPTKGVHIAFSKQKLPVKEAIYIDTIDERLIFVIPRQNHVYVGTTDTTYSDDFRFPKVSREDIFYLLNALNRKFPDLSLGYDDIVSCWAGIRPLIGDWRNKPGEISRKDELFLADNGLLTITGGKLTGYRLMAKKVVDNVLVFLNKDEVGCKTANLKLSGSEWDDLLTTDKLVEQADFAFDEAKQTGISPEDFKVLFYRYGKNIDKITEKAYEYINTNNNAEQAWLKAELWFGVNYEMLTQSSDFFTYRTEMVLFDPDRISKIKDGAHKFLSEQLNWSEKEKEHDLIKLEKDWKIYQKPLE